MIASDLVQLARSIPRDQRKNMLLSMPEPEIHRHLASLFKRMEPDYLVEITHGASEFGKDLVIVRQDKLSADVIAVIVKRGDIRGKTAGDIDEIRDCVEGQFGYESEHRLAELLSQIRQATTHDAELKALFKQLPVSRVIVVLCGELSKSARLRLQREIHQPVQVNDLTWLVDSLTEFCPQVFFAGEAVDFLHGRILELEHNHFLSKTGKTLSECFVEPLVCTFEVPLTLDEALALAVKKRRLPFSDLRALLEQRRNLFLVGDPGTGKSGALAKIAIDLYLQAYHQLTQLGSRASHVPIPALLKAATILELDSADELVARLLPNPDLQGRFLIHVLLVDGLDEVSPADRGAVVTRAREFSRQLACSLVITTRKIDILSTAQEGFQQYELMPFEFGQAMKLVRKLIASEDALSALSDGLERIGTQIPIIPLSLLLLVDLVQERKEVPSSVTELYERFLDMVLGRWDREKGIEVLFEYLVKERFLGALAYKEFHAKGRLSVEHREFDAFVASYAGEYGWNAAELESFIKEIERGGVLGIGQQVVFTHRSFLDYFVALHLFDKRADIPDVNQKVVGLYFHPLWSEVAFFYIGMAREVSAELLSLVFDFQATGLSIDAGKLLAGHLLQAGWHSPTAVKREGIRRAVGYASAVRDELLAACAKSDAKLPKLMADLFVMVMSEFSFGSIFLSKETREVIEELAVEVSDIGLYEGVSLLWATRRFMDAGELREAVSSQLHLIGDLTSISPEDEARMLLLLMIIEKKDPALARAIKRKVHKLQKRAPGALRALLPPRKKGFR